MSQRRAVLVTIETLIPFALIANEIWLSKALILINPIEGISREEQTLSFGYIDEMKQDFANLSEGLECR
ncbi:MAG TPA: hypothetical protein VGE82_00225 [Nitrososphaera sp.]|jgi:hypothetical protein